jgi:hypothetical protein
MIEANRIKYLRVALMAVGVIFIAGIYSLIMIWTSGWSWHSGPPHSLPHYLQMILGVYATLGIFLLIASRTPPNLVTCGCRKAVRDIQLTSSKSRSSA